MIFRKTVIYLELLMLISWIGGCSTGAYLNDKLLTEGGFASFWLCVLLGLLLPRKEKVKDK